MSADQSAWLDTPTCGIGVRWAAGRRVCEDCGRYEYPPLHPSDPNHCPACDGRLVEEGR